MLIDWELGEIVIVVNTGAEEVIVIADMLLVIELYLAVMLALPIATPVTSPEELTVAFDVLLLVHVKVGHVMIELFWSLHVAVSCTVCVVLIDDVVGVIAIVVSTGVGILGVPVVDPVAPSRAL